MSTGRQGSNSSAQQLHLEGQRPGARGGGVDALAEALEQGAQLGVERRRLALGGAADAERPHQPVDRQPLLAGHLGDPAARRRGGRSPSARAGPGRGRSPAANQRSAAAPASTWGTPQRSRRTRTGPSSPSSSIVPSASAAAAAPASARPPPSPRRRARSRPPRPTTPFAPLARRSSSKRTGWPASTHYSMICLLLANQARLHRSALLCGRASVSPLKRSRRGRDNVVRARGEANAIAGAGELLLGALTLLLAAPASAADHPGALDASFGKGGRALVPGRLQLADRP